MAASINGAQWHSDSAAAFGYFIQQSGNDSGITNLMVTATQKLNNSTQTITFNISNYTGPNTYTINPPYNTAAYYINNIRHYADTGVFTITRNTGFSLLGTFSFRADTFTVVSGSFDVALP